MRVALFVPCYVDQLRPEVGLASLDLLERAGFEVAVPEDQTCCGQPFLTAGETDRAADLGRRFVDVFEGYEAIVTPSGSCAATVRHHLGASARAADVARRTRELCEFLVEHDSLGALGGRFPHRVGLHASCHALRELRLGRPSESLEAPRADPARRLLESLDDLELVSLGRTDECCGFGGVFSILEEAVSVRMGLDRLADHRRAGAEVLTSSDVSCLLHLEGLARRQGQAIEILHVAELLDRGVAARPAEDGRGARGEAG